MTNVTVANRPITVEARTVTGGAKNVQVQTGSAITVSAKMVGIQGAPGSGGAVYTHTQSPAAMVWTIDHNLGFYPTVMVYDETGEQVLPQVTNPTTNRTTLNFASALAGTARLT